MNAFLKRLETMLKSEESFEAVSIKLPKVDLGEEIIGTFANNRQLMVLYTILQELMESLMDLTACLDGVPQVSMTKADRELMARMVLKLEELQTVKHLIRLLIYELVPETVAEPDLQFRFGWVLVSVPPTDPLREIARSMIVLKKIDTAGNVAKTGLQGRN